MKPKVTQSSNPTAETKIALLLLKIQLLAKSLTLLEFIDLELKVWVRYGTIRLNFEEKYGTKSRAVF